MFCEMTRQEQKGSKAKYCKLREEYLERQQQIVSLTSDMREDLAKLQASVQEQLIQENSGGESLPEDMDELCERSVPEDMDGLCEKDRIEANTDTIESSNVKKVTRRGEKCEGSDSDQSGADDGVETDDHDKADQGYQPFNTDPSDLSAKGHPDLVASREQQQVGGDIDPAGGLSEGMDDDRATRLRREGAKKLWSKVRCVAHPCYYSRRI